MVTHPGSRSANHAHRDQATSDTRYQCTGGGRGRYHLIYCLPEGKARNTGGEALLQSLSEETIPKHVIYATWIIGERERSWQEIRRKGCQEHLVHPHQAESLFVWAEVLGAEQSHQPLP